MWRRLIDYFPAKTFIEDANGKLIFISRRWQEYTGRAISPQLNPGVWIDAIHPDDRARVVDLWKSSIAAGHPYEAEYRLQHHNKGYRWVLQRAFPMRNDVWKEAHWFGTVVDINRTKEAERAATLTNLRYEALIEATRSSIWRADHTGALIAASAERDIQGYTPEDLIGDKWIDLVHPDDRCDVEAAWSKSVREESPYQHTFRVITPGGDHYWASGRAVPLKNPTGGVEEWIGIVTNVNDTKTTSDRIAASEERWELASRAGALVAWELDRDRSMLIHQGGLADELEIGSISLEAFKQRILEDDRDTYEAFLAEIVERGQASAEFRFKTRKSENVWLKCRGQKGLSGRIIGITSDISEQKKLEQKLWRAANLDGLTGLANRRLLASRAQELFAQAAHNQSRYAVFLLDFDHFKQINDTLGHDAGDRFLAEVAQRLALPESPFEITARLSGDEFAIIMNCQSGDYSSAARDILQGLSAPFRYAGHTISVGASIGVAFFPDHGTTLGDLLKCADIALYDAKSSGRMCMQVYDPTLGEEFHSRSRLVEELRRALVKRHQLVPYYQPKVCLESGRIIGLEVLTRWMHPQKGVLSPRYFKAAFDDTRMSMELNAHIFRLAASDMRRWLDDGINPGIVSFNLPTAVLLRPELIDFAFEAFDKYSIPSEFLEVELTEDSLLTQNLEKPLQVLGRFAGRGISIALDDFGTGFASLIHLKKFPLNHVKIDRAFVRMLIGNSRDQAVIKGIVQICKDLDLNVTAEGIETEAQLRVLREIGCKYGQGYLFSRAIDADSVATLFRKEADDGVAWST